MESKAIIGKTKKCKVRGKAGSWREGKLLQGKEGRWYTRGRGRRVRQC